MDGEERAGLLLHAITFVIVTESSTLRGHCHEPIQYREKRISLPAKATSTVDVTLLVPNLATCQLCGASVAKQDLCFLTAS